jgi:delta14-sterol reductase
LFSIHFNVFAISVHLYTYDLFAEKIGFKLCWGCLVFYPFFYPIGVYSIIFAPSTSDISATAAIGILSIFFLGWMITRGANLQKFYFRTQPEHKTFLFGLVAQKTVPGSRILCSGWWGVSRHFNYFGEILQALALALPGWLMTRDSSLWYAVLPWLYPAYYVALFIPRQLDHDLVCSKKYGDVWDEYVKLVPYRIVPGVW